MSHDNGSYDRGMGMDARAGQWGWSAFAGTDQVIGGAPVRQNEWTFLAVTVIKQPKTTKLWVGDAEFTAQTSEMGEGHEFLWIGGNPSYGEHFVGDIANVKI